MKKVLILEGRETIGGGQVITRKICKILSEKYEISVLVPGENNEISSYLKDYRLYHYPFKDYTRGKKTIRDIFVLFHNTFNAYRVLRQILKHNKFHMVYVQHQNMLHIAVLTCNKTQKIISHLHVVNINRLSKIFIEHFLSSQKVKKIIGVSHYVLSKLSLSNKHKSEVIYNPISIKKKIIKNDFSYRLAVVGDVAPYKNQQLLMEAIKILDKEVEIYFIGNIVDDKYKQLLDNYPLKKYFTGFINDVSSYLAEKKIDLVVVPSSSKFETFSLAMGEAWSLGIPTIATNAFGMREIVDKFLPKYKEYMLFRLDDASDLAYKIKGFYSNKDRYEQISNDTYDVIKTTLNDKRFRLRLFEILESI